MKTHIARAWSDHEMEDGCPCPKAPCGFVILGEFSPGCFIHDWTKTIRQGHWEDQCPA